MVEVDVRDRGDAAVPGVGRVEPAAEPDLDDGQVDPLLGEPAEGDGRQQLELGRRAGPAGDPSGRVEDLADEPGERRRVDEPAVDLEPLAVAHQVRLGGLGDAIAGGPQRRPGEGEDAALAVRAADERAAEGELRVAELAEERPGPAQPEPDPETTAVLEGPERLLVGEVAQRHSRDSSSS